MVTRTRGGERTLYRELAELASIFNRSSSLTHCADRLKKKSSVWMWTDLLLQGNHGIDREEIGEGSCLLEAASEV